MKSTKLLGIALATSCVLLTGCVVAPAPMSRSYYGQPVMVEPPPPRVEYAGSPPVVGQIWLGGFWNWTGRRHEWSPGPWEAPRQGYAWTPNRWQREGDQWRMQGGQWERNGGGRQGRDEGYRDERHDRRDGR